jgi:FlaA1/EpsC-like NDP-sugar epimerase
MSGTDRLLATLRAALRALSERLGRRAKQALLLGLDLCAAPLAALAALLVFGGAPALRDPALVPALLTAAVLGGGAAALGGLPRMKLNAFAPRGLVGFAAVTAAAAAAWPLAVELPGGGLAAAGFALAFFYAAVGLRLALRTALVWARRAPRRAGVLIYGASDAGIRLAAALREDPAVAPAAFLDDAPALHGLILGGLAVHPPAEAAALARRTGADRVLIAVPGASPQRQADIAACLAAQGLRAMAVPSFAEIVGEAAAPGLLAVPAARFLGRTALCPQLDAAAAAYSGKTVLVTGAGGSVGGELCRQLLLLGPRRLVLFDLSEAALYAIDAELADRAAALGVALRPVIGSVTDRVLLSQLMAAEGVEVVLHAAACKHVPLVEANPLAGLSTNVLGTRTAAQAARQAGAERFVLVSTDKAVRPAGVMGLSKRLAECVVADLARAPSATAMAAVRFGNVLGSSGSVLPRFRDQIARGGPVTLTHEDATRYFMTLPEAAQLVLLAGAMAAPGRAETFVLDMGRPVRIRDLAERMIAAAGLTIRSPANPQGHIAIEVTGLRPGEKLHEELTFDGAMAATAHPKVLRLCETPAGPRALAGTLLALRAAVGSGDAAAAVAAARACLGPELGTAPLPAPAGAPDRTAPPARLRA